MPAEIPELFDDDDLLPPASKGSGRGDETRAATAHDRDLGIVGRRERRLFVFVWNFESPPRPL